MFHKLMSIYPIGSMKMLAHFAQGELRLYDASQLVERWPQFRALEDDTFFRTVKVDAGGYGISWNDDLDLSADELYENGQVFELVVRETNRVVSELVEARRVACFSQKGLEEATGVKQSAIARMETGGAVPRLDTLLRLLGPLGKTLKVIDLSEV